MLNLKMNAIHIFYNLYLTVSDGLNAARRILLLSFLCFSAAYWILSVSDATAQENNTETETAVSEISLGLEDAVNIAVAVNRDILKSAFRLKNQKLSLRTARSDFDLKIFPNASGGVGGDESETQKSFGAGLSLQKKLTLGPRISLEPEIKKGDTSYESGLGVSFEIPLFRGAGREVTLDGVYTAEYSIRNAERSHYQTLVSTVLSTISAFYEVEKQKSLVRLNENLKNRMYGHAETARAKEKVGLATPIDVYRAEIQLKNVEDRLTGAVESLRSAEDELKTILTLPLETGVTVIAPLKCEDIHVTETKAIETAVKKRWETEQAEDDFNHVVRQSKIAKNKLLPELKIVGNYSRLGTSEDFDQSMTFDEDRWGFQVIADTDLSRDSEKANYQKSLTNIKNAGLRIKEVRENIIKEVRSHLRFTDKAKARIGIRQEQIVQAEGKLALAQVKFNFGMATNFDLIEAETELERARSELLSAKIDYIVGTYKFRAVLGTLIERSAIHN
ncbi:TolC family protein [Desulfobacterales bacterium HSG2]|nr:TolC family protein [Desulfobacterales bacterium HSG2]